MSRKLASCLDQKSMFSFRAMDVIRLLSLFFIFFLSYHITGSPDCRNKSDPKAIVDLSADMSDVYVDNISFSHVVVPAHLVHQLLPVHDDVLIGQQNPNQLVLPMIQFHILIPDRDLVAVYIHDHSVSEKFFGFLLSSAPLL